MPDERMMAAFERYIKSMGRYAPKQNNVWKRELLQCFEYGWNGGVGAVPDETATQYCDMPSHHE